MPEQHPEDQPERLAAAEQPPIGADENQPALIDLVEAVIFASEDPLTPARISRILDQPGIGEIRVQHAIDELQQRYQGGVRLMQAQGAWYLSTTPAAGRVVSRTLLGSRRSRSSRALLETLAVIAYNQPATKADVEAIRGVDCSSPVKRLLERGLISVAGRKNAPGKPFVYTTTRRFLRDFGLESLSELPVPGEAQELEQQDE